MKPYIAIAADQATDVDRRRLRPLFAWALIDFAQTCRATLSGLHFVKNTDIGRDDKRRRQHFPRVPYPIDEKWR